MSQEEKLRSKRKRMMIILKHFQPESTVNSTRINTLEPIVALLKIKLSLMWTADKSARRMQDAITLEREKNQGSSEKFEKAQPRALYLVLSIHHDLSSDTD